VGAKTFDPTACVDNELGFATTCTTFELVQFTNFEVLVKLVVELVEVEVRVFSWVGAVEEQGAHG